jgi:hypothetical protein
LLIVGLIRYVTILWCFVVAQNSEIAHHGWLAAALRMGIYLWWEMQLKMSVDQEHFTRRTMLRGGKQAPVRCGDEVQEFCDLFHFLRPARRREHIMGKVVNVVPLPAVRA